MMQIAISRYNHHVGCATKCSNFYIFSVQEEYPDSLTNDVTS